MITSFHVQLVNGVYEGHLYNDGNEIGSCTSARLFTAVDCLCQMVSEHERGDDE